MRNKKLILLFILVLLIQLPICALAEDGIDGYQDQEIFGLEVDKLLAFGSAHLAAALSLLTFIAYYKTKRKRLMFVGFAFLLFSAKLFMISSELFIDEIVWVDIASAALDFAILLSFFFGVIRK